jgi:hypothetical protein
VEIAAAGRGVVASEIVSAFDDRRLRSPGVKDRVPGREHPLRTQFAKFSLRGMNPVMQHSSSSSVCSGFDLPDDAVRRQ